MPDALPLHAADTWNQRFNTEDYVFGTAPNAWLTTQAARLQPGQRALAVADGEGRNSVWLAQQGLQVDAFDVSEVGVRKARLLAEQRGVSVHYQVADCDPWPMPEGIYDVVVAIFIQFADPAMRARLFDSMARSLKPGGLLLLQGYTPAQLQFNTGGPPHLSHLYTPDGLAQELAALDILEVRDYEADLAEGARHVGRSALLGLVARKAP